MKIILSFLKAEREEKLKEAALSPSVRLSTEIAYLEDMINRIESEDEALEDLERKLEFEGYM